MCGNKSATRGTLGLDGQESRLGFDISRAVSVQSHDMPHMGLMAGHGYCLLQATPNVPGVLEAGVPGTTRPGGAGGGGSHRFAFPDPSSLQLCAADHIFL